LELYLLNISDLTTSHFYCLSIQIEEKINLLHRAY